MGKSEVGTRAGTGRALLFSLVESPSHPDFSYLYRSLGIQELRFSSMRKALSALKDRPPDYVVGEFFYGYGSNYAGVNVCNLDVFLYALQRYAPGARVVVVAQRPELPYVQRLKDLFSLHAVLIHPVGEQEIRAVLLDRNGAVWDSSNNPGSPGI